MVIGTFTSASDYTSRMGKFQCRQVINSINENFTSLPKQSQGPEKYFIKCYIGDIEEDTKILFIIREESYGHQQQQYLADKFQWETLIREYIMCQILYTEIKTYKFYQKFI